MLSLLDPLVIIHTLGLLGIWGIIFGESCLFFGFFLPGDSLLFTAGFLAGQHFLNPVALLLGCLVAVVAGDSVGYWFGDTVGPRIFAKEDSLFFRKSHIEKTNEFYERYGTKTIVLARFVPIVRTFAPILAGVGSMKYRTFFFYNVIGGVLWVCLFLGLGYFLGAVVPGVDRYITLVIIGVIVLSLMPLVYEIVKARKKRQ